MWAPLAQLSSLCVQLGRVRTKLCPPVGMCRLSRTGVVVGFQYRHHPQLQDGEIQAALLGTCV